MTGSVSAYKGVSWHRHNRMWQAEIQAADERYHLGYFADEVKAAEAYDDKAIELHRAFARLNFPRRAPELASPPPG